MERRRYPRFAVNIKAALLHNQAMPMGCRVRDVSAGGMLLQYEHYNNSQTFVKGDTVELRLSLKQDNHRKVIPLPMTVMRVEENGIGARFVQPQTELMTLIEPYMLDHEERQKTAAVHAQSTATGTDGRREPGTGVTPRAQRRRYAIKRARAQVSGGADQRHTDESPADVAPVKGEDRKLFYVGLLSLAAAAGIVVFGLHARYQENDRFSSLQSAINQQANSLSLLRTRMAQSNTHKKELSEIGTRVDSLEASFASLEAKVLRPANKIPTAVVTDTPAMPGSVAISALQENKTRDSESPTAAPSSLATTPSETRPWVVNLVSLYDETSANSFARKARSRGVPADINPTTVKGREVWRVQIDGFSSREEASTYGETSRHKLGLGSIWIFQRRH